MSYTNKPIVFTDMHHSSLLYSLILLFEGRLGGKVYRPIGLEWANEGYWKVFDHPATIQQYLTLAQGYQPVDGTKPLNNIDKVEDGVYYCQDIDSGYYNKAITLDKFKSMDIDIVIASLPQHIEPFKKLIETSMPNAKLVYQIGNSWTVEAGLAQNVMASAIIEGVPDNINFVSYHQEFDLNVFKPTNANEDRGFHQLISSYVNCFNVVPHHAEDWQLFEKVESLMPGWVFSSLGGQCRDGACHGSQQLADSMNNTRFIWHTKYGGDGYGHIIFNAAACGKPMIVKKGYYIGKLGEKLFRDGETCISIDGLNPHEIVNKILYYDDPKRYQELRHNVYDNFKKLVNFDLEEIKLKKFLDNLK